MTDKLAKKIDAMSGSEYWLFLGKVSLGLAFTSFLIYTFGGRDVAAKYISFFCAALVFVCAALSAAFASTESKDAHRDL